MKKVPISVHRTNGDQAIFLIPDNLDYLEVRGIVETVMEQIQLDALRQAVNYTLINAIEDELNNLLERSEHD